MAWRRACRGLDRVQMDGNEQAAPATPAAPGGELDALAVTRIVVRPMASPLPIGFFATAIATSMVACLELNIFKAADHQAVAYVMLSAFVLQIIVAIAALAARDTLVASLMATFAGAWLVDGLISLTSPLGSQHVLAAYFIIFSLFLVMMAVAARFKRAIFIVLVLSVPHFFFFGISSLTGTTWQADMAGVFGFAVAIAALYTAFALLLEDAHDTSKLPIGRSGAALTALHGSLADQLEGIENSAGVRRSL